jgi:hypothetical protein
MIKRSCAPYVPPKIPNLAIWYNGFMKDNGDVEFLDLFDPRQPRSDKELIEKRLEICNQCEWLHKRLQKCRKCGCFMHLKSTLKQATCPLGKW